MSNTTWLSDEPIETEKNDEFDFRETANTLAELIMESYTPMIIGVHGSWGSGKTSLMKLTQERLKKEEVSCTWLDTWALAQEKEIWRVIMCALVDDLDPDNKKGINKTKLIRSILSMASIIGKAILTGGLSLVTDSKETGEALEEAKEIDVDRARIMLMDQIKTVRTFRREFEEAVKKSVGPQGKYVVFIDDLDRVRPEKTLEILEAIKIFMSTQKCVFVIGCDLNHLDLCTKMVYKEIEYSGKDYLEKIIQIPFNVPTIASLYLDNFLLKNLQHLEIKKNLEKIRELVLKSVGKNPRTIKGLINRYTTTEKFADKVEGIDKLVLFKLLCFQCKWPELYQFFTKAYLEHGENKFLNYEIWAIPIHELTFDEYMGWGEPEVPDFDEREPPDEVEYKGYLETVKNKKAIQEKINTEITQLDAEKLRMFTNELNAFFQTEPSFESLQLDKYLRLIGEISAR